jgi:hypothetical protein
MHKARPVSRWKSLLLRRRWHVMPHMLHRRWWRWRRRWKEWTISIRTNSIRMRTNVWRQLLAVMLHRRRRRWRKGTSLHWTRSASAHHGISSPHGRAPFRPWPWIATMRRQWMRSSLSTHHFPGWKAVIYSSTWRRTLTSRERSATTLWEVRLRASTSRKRSHVRLT